LGAQTVPDVVRCQPLERKEMAWPIRPLVPVLHDQGQSLDDHVRIDESLKVFPTLLIHQIQRIYCRNALKIIVFGDDSFNA
jgi:hypothetical protein